jgi:predicted amidophosphoribosyltransferase
LIESLPPSFNLSDFTLVPMPPSKRNDHPYYDDRMLKVLQILKHEKNIADVRNIFSLLENREAVHTSSGKRSPTKIAGNLIVNKNECFGAKKNILLIDDMVTSGAQFIACKTKLAEQLPDSIVKGLFITRRTFL